MAMTRKQIEALVRMKKRAEKDARSALTAPPPQREKALVEGYKGTVDLKAKSYKVPVIEVTAEMEEEQDENRKRVLAAMSEEPSEDDLEDEE